MTDHSQVAGAGVYTLKRLRDGVSLDQVLDFLKRISQTTFRDGERIDYSFASIFQNVQQSTLLINTKNRQQSIADGENPSFFLYKSDLAYLYSDLIRRFDNNLEDFKGTEDYNRLKALNIYCENHDGDLEISGENDVYLNGLLTDLVGRTTRFILPLLEDSKPKEAETVPQETEANNEDQLDPQLVAAALNDRNNAQPVDPADLATVGNENGSVVPSTDRLTNDPIATKNLLFSKDLREQAAKFTGIAIAQLEQQNGLPPGSLANSPDLQKVLSDKTMGFFLTTLGDGRAKDLIDPETRLTLIREYIWLVQNDFRTTAIISNRLENLQDLQPSQTNQLEVTLPDGTTKTISSEKELKEQVTQAISNASGVSASIAEKIITGINGNTELTTIFEKLGNNQLIEDRNGYLIQETTKLLQQELQRIGVQTDKISLAEKNVVNVVDAWILQGLPLDILKYVDDGKFKLIFGEEIPYNPTFLESLEEIWIARRSILGKRTGQLLLHNEARFATQEALALFDESKKLLTKKEANQVFERGIAAPTRQILVGSKGTAVKDPAEIIELTNGKKSATNSEKREVFLKQVWSTKDTNVKQEILVVLGYGDPGSKAIQNLAENADFYPKEIGLHDMAPLLGGAAFYDQSQINNYQSNYIPNQGIIQNPLANVGQFAQKTKNLTNKLRGGIKGIGSRFSKKAAQKAADKAAEAGLSTVASTATGAINPALGFLTKLASTKKGRRALLIGGAVGVGSLVVPLTTLGGQIGAALGSLVGGIFGGPGGAVLGGISGSWTGYGIQKWFGDLFSKSPSSNLINPLTSQATASPLAQSALNSATTTTATQAAALNTASTTFVGQTITHVAGQAVLGTVGLITASELMFQSTVLGALTANFPVVEPLGAFSIDGVDGKVSEFVSIEKRAFIAGCPENKCESPSFPIKVEYTVTIAPKGNYTIQILDATDTLKVNHSKKAWEEKGKTPPTIPERIKKLADFPELYEEIIIEPGDSVTLVYSESLDEKYNDASITNRFELKVFAKDPATGKEGTDTAITGEIVYIGDYSQGEGCWPTSGTMLQLPFNQGPDSTHSRWDAFDIVNVEGTPIYTPFGGKACPGTRDASIYGIHVTLQSDKGTFQFSHMHATNGLDNGCKDLQPGDVVGYMGTTGMGGVHLDWAKIGRGSAPSDLAPMMPDGLSIKPGDPVRSCYDGG
ncbi:MAG: hypothetical protein IT416_05160 [Candidatus Pacebacteria bacterium]|nr:hypothetical protein [Candidatus Paceibacterota bacterium]